MRTLGYLIKRLALDSKEVLDVGSSEGRFLARFGEGSVGVTIIPEHVALATEKGLTVVLGNIEDPSFILSQKFDAVWANNIFEHLNAPHLFLMNIKKFIKPDGMLILGVPVIPVPAFLTRFKKFRGAYAVSHVNFFTRRTLVDTVRSAGWDIVEARSFHFERPWVDALFNTIAPHMYIVARPVSGFVYPNKRLRSLQGYGTQEHN